MLTNILIVDSNVEFRHELAQQLRQFFTVRTCADGSTALDLLRHGGVDFLITDLMLPGIDGLELLKNAHREGICPPTLVSSVSFPPYAAQALQSYNVVYMILKPCLIDALVQRVRELVDVSSPQILFRSATEATVSAVLRELGMNTSRIGYHNCRDAIVMLAANPRLQMTKEVYPALADPPGGDWRAVEKNIRDAIHDAWLHRSDPVWQRYFPCAPNGDMPRPSNKVFLTTLTEILFARQRAAR